MDIRQEHRLLDALTVVVKLVLIAAVAGWATNRLLAVRRGLLPTLLLGLTGWLIAALLARPAYDGIHLDEAGYALSTAPLGVMAAMVLGVVLLALQPRTREPKLPEALGRIGRLPRPIRRVRRAVEPVTRVREVSAIARRHELPRLVEQWRSGQGDEATLNRAVRATLEEAGGMFVKLGQVASTRADLLPAPLIAELAELRADVAPESAETIRTALEAELHAPVEAVFAEFDWEPLAAASIGQIHRARLPSGEPVVVKVQRPAVADLVARDGAALLTLAGFVDRRTSIGLRFDVVGLASEFVDGLKAELDFRSEASNAALVAEQQAATGLTVPKVYGELTTPRVLVMDEVIGSPVDRGGAIERSGTSRSALAQQLLETMLDQMFQRGVFHADPHPGNVFVTADGGLALIDFGSVGVLSRRMIENLRQMAVGAATGDPTVLRRAVIQIAGTPGAGTDLKSLEDELGRFLSVSLSGTSALSGELFGQMLDVMRTHDLAPPPGLTLLTRALITLEGTLRVIDPDYSMAVESRAVAERWAGDALQADNVQELLQGELVKALPLLQSLPDRIDRLMSLGGAGALSIRTRVIDHPDDRRFVARWTSRVLFAAVGSFGLLASGILLLAGSAANGENLQQGLTAAGVSGLFASLVLVLRAVAGALRDSDA